MATGIFNNGDYTVEDDSNGDLVVTDPNDNTVLKWDTSIPGWTFNNNAISNVSDLDVGTVSTNEASVTNETLIKTTGDSTKSAIAADSWETPDFGVAAVDDRNEFDASASTFSVDKGGWYQVFARARLANTPSDEDRLQGRIKQGGGAVITESPEQPTSGAQVFQPFPGVAEIVNLDGGENYKYEVRNRDSQYDIDDFGAFLSVRRILR